MRCSITRLGYAVVGLFFAGVLYEALLHSTFLILVPFATSLFLLVYIHKPSVRRLVHRRFLIVWIIVLLVTRLGFFVMYLGYGRVTWDLTDVFYSQAKSVLQGKLPNIGFPTHYSQYFPYLLGIPVALVDDPYSLVVYFAAFDVLVGVGIWRIAGRIAKKSAGNLALQELPRTAVMLYILCPASFYVTIFWNQQEVVTAFLLLLLAYAYIALERRPDRLLVVVPLAMAAAFAMSYLLVCVGLFGISMLFYDPELKRKLILRSGAVVLALYLPFLLMGVSFRPVIEEFGYGAIGNNPFAVLEAFSLKVGPLPYVALGAAFVLIYFAVTNGRTGCERAGLPVICIPLLAYLVFMTLSKKSVSFYSVVFLPFLAVFVAAKPKLADLYVIYGLANTFASHFADKPNLDALVRLLPVGAGMGRAIVLAFMAAIILMMVAIQLAFIRELLRPYWSILVGLRPSRMLRFYANQLRSLLGLGRAAGEPKANANGPAPRTTH